MADAHWGIALLKSLTIVFNLWNRCNLWVSLPLINLQYLPALAGEMIWYSTSNNFFEKYKFFWYIYNIEINNPHDKVFKQIETVKENAFDLIKGTFPKNLTDKMDLDSLELDNNSYLDKKLQEYYSDLVYECSYSGNIKIKIFLS